MIRPLLTAGPSRAALMLQRPTARVPSCDGAVKRLFDDMIDTMRAADGGVGLAAVQVGVPWRVIVAEVDGHLYQLLNPEMVDRRAAREHEVAWESCLSTPDLLAAVPSAEQVTVTAQDRANKPVRLVARGLLARVLRHEIDHCNGVLITQRMIGEPQSLIANLTRAHQAVTDEVGVVASQA